MKTKLEFSKEDFSIPAWLYQMSSGGSGGLWVSGQNTPWYPSNYRQDVIEGLQVTWDVGRIYFREQGPVLKDDTVIFFFCKTGENDPNTGDFQPGIYGWGKIIKPPQNSKDQITFVAEPPNDYLKMNVLWDNDIQRITNEIRDKQNQGTMWPISRHHLKELQRKILGILPK